MLESRKKLENSIRKIKRLRRECPYRTDKDACAKVFIRCGERTQYSLRESTNQQMHPHKCTYSLTQLGGRALIVDEDVRIREFCKQTLALFLGRSDADSAATDSLSEAVELLNRSKISGKKFGLVIVDAALKGNGGYRLINELYKRNYEADIILTKNESTRAKPPTDYLGDAEIAPNERFVNCVLAKPFHSEELVDALKKLRFR